MMSEQTLEVMKKIIANNNFVIFQIGFCVYKRK